MLIRLDLPIQIVNKLLISASWLLQPVMAKLIRFIVLMPNRVTSLNFLTSLFDGIIIISRVIDIEVRFIKMEIFEAGNLSHQNLNINWTMAPNDKGQSKKTMVMVISSISNINTMTNSCCLTAQILVSYSYFVGQCRIK